MSLQLLKRGIVFVFFANIINLIFNLLSNFLLPRFLSVETYADIKTFQLMTSYIGLFSFGYVDGIYLKYGGENLESTDETNLGVELSTFRLSQIIISIICILISIPTRKIVFFTSALSILFLNVCGYIKSLYQATGEFKVYARVTQITAIITFIMNMLLVFVFKITNSSYIYLISYTLLYLIIWIYLELGLINRFDKKLVIFSFSFKKIIEISKMGILLMLGNFSSIILTSLDRWFVKILFSTLDFALYSFAVSIEGILNVAVTPVTITLYNYFSKVTETTEIKKIYGLVEIFSVFLVSISFLAKLILEVFIPKYIDSSKIMFLLFGSQVFYVIIKSVYVNLYKVRKQQNIYFKKLISVIIIGLLLNIILFQLHPIVEIFALGTLLSSVYWLIISQSDFKDLGLTFIDLLYPILEVLLLILCGFYLNSIVGLFIYSILSCVATIVLRKKNLIVIKKLLLKNIKIKNKIAFARRD